MLKTLAEIRKGKKLTQSELGQLVGVSQRAIAAYEAGERRPSPKVMNRLISELDIPIDVAWRLLYGDSDAEETADGDDRA